MSLKINQLLARASLMCYLTYESGNFAEFDAELPDGDIGGIGVDATWHEDGAALAVAVGVVALAVLVGGLHDVARVQDEPVGGVMGEGRL